MRKSRRWTALALVMALAAAAFGFASPAFAADAAKVPQVRKTLQMNEGSTVTATFSYTITPKALSTGNGSEQTYTDGPAATVEDITLSDATSTANNTGTGAIKFGGATDASNFTHAGVYAWTIKENQSVTNGPSNGEFQFDGQTYTLIATVVPKDGGGFQFGAVVVAKGDVATTTNDDKVSGDTIPFDQNKYTENTNDQPDNPNPDNPDNPDNPNHPNTNLVVTKTVTGAQGDKSKQFAFTVTFTAPSVLPAGKTAADVLNAINPVVKGGATITDAGTVAAGATSRTITFTAADAQGVTFANLLVGTKYEISEASVDGYTQSYAAVANGNNVTTQQGVLVGEKTNTGTMTNKYQDITPTGLIVNNLPFVLMGAVAVAGMVLYGTAKRKLER
ncbi:hypothetical protein J2S71_000398 [Olsenella profusa DSM 13989]|uniref:DUF7601 domain-containing protein n=1 Tax=Olsenella profusa F0195 TaxID=1125712 RepID=U2TJF5_9ACTN|nr:hypothetical protein [Olsenella profusa]ERL06318.1 hypothetical protein HMPREF1316_1193 [Olsenella profusa F0195]MDP9858702.1 hypothetical protein [Olsenella profusa DSM 13989]